MGDIEIPSLGLNIRGEGSQPEGVVNNIMQPFESTFSMMGMTTPLYRFMGVGLMSAGVFWLFRPSSMFSQNGYPLPWSIWSGQSSESAAVPWWLAAFLVGLAAAVFF